MKFYYYVLSFNLSNPVVRSMIERQSLFSGTEQMIDLKVRSRPYLSFTEATFASHTDYSKKHEILFPEDFNDQSVRHVCVINPDFMIVDGNEDVIEQFNAAKYVWSENCCSALFFASPVASEDGIETTHFGKLNKPTVDDLLNSWMLKYEVMSYDSMIEHASNGDFVFSGACCQSSVFH